MLEIFRRRAPKTSPQERLEAAKAITLPPDTGFQTRVATAEKIEGMFSPFSMAVIDTLLKFQASRGITGNMLEVGVYKGRSAALLAAHLAPLERLTLVDIHDYLDHDGLKPFEHLLEVVITPSNKMRSTVPGYRKRRNSFRFIHIDASHGFEETFFEMGLAEELLANGGIIAMDDFTNLNYSQNTAAIFRYLFTTKTKLSMLLATDEKAYLCRRIDFDAYADLVFNLAVPEMESRGVDATLARTSFEPDYKAYYLRPRGDGEGRFYGENIYFSHLAAQ